jgi:hypothetical protein
MTDDQATIPVRPRRRGVDADTPNGRDFEIEQFFASMQRSRRDQPVPVEILVGPWLFDEELATALESGDGPRVPPDPISILLVATDVRVIFPDNLDTERHAPWAQYPEFEVDVRVLNPPGNPQGEVHMRLALRTTDDDRLIEGTAYLLDLLEVRGTDWTPGMG